MADFYCTYPTVYLTNRTRGPYITGRYGGRRRVDRSDRVGSR